MGTACYYGNHHHVTHDVELLNVLYVGLVGTVSVSAYYFSTAFENDAWLCYPMTAFSASMIQHLVLLLPSTRTRLPDSWHASLWRQQLWDDICCTLWKMGNSKYMWLAIVIIFNFQRCVTKASNEQRGMEPVLPRCYSGRLPRWRGELKEICTDNKLLTFCW